MISVSVLVGRTMIRLGGPYGWDVQRSLMEPRAWGFGLFVERWYR
jgi:hypothetical protein